MSAPCVFIPVAEASGQIVALGNYVLDAACKQISVWLKAGTPLRVAVNLSAHQLRQVNLVEQVSSCLTRYEVPPQWLELEVTESQAMLNLEQGREVLQGLARLGVTIALDDFGTGHSSLAYLQYLPLQRIKLGREFLSPSPCRDRLMGGIVHMAHALDLEVVAEERGRGRTAGPAARHWLRILSRLAAFPRHAEQLDAWLVMV